jgi:transposase, IS5 family
MTCRDFSQPSFAEAFVVGYTHGGGFLQEIDQAFNWSAFGVLLAQIHGSEKGAPGYPPITMFKIVLLQQWYTLSDPAAEEAVRDRLSFRRFCGLPLDRETPDHSSIWRFRQAIDARGLSEALLAEANRQLDARGLVFKSGTLVDATLIAAAVKRPPYGGGGVNPRDPDARFTKKRGETYFGYKAHVAVDEGSGLVRKAQMTSANLHDSQLGEAMIQGDEQGFFADKAYDSQEMREALRKRGLADGILWKVKHKRYPLETWQKCCNLWAAGIRSAVQRAPATMKRWYGMSRVRYLGLARNNCHLQFVATAMNMKRALVLLQEG